MFTDDWKKKKVEKKCSKKGVILEMIHRFWVTRSVNIAIETAQWYPLRRQLQIFKPRQGTKMKQRNLSHFTDNAFHKFKEQYLFVAK